MCHFAVDLGSDGREYFRAELEDLSRLEDAGLLELDGVRLKLTALGRVFVRNVAMVFDAHLRRQQVDVAPTFSMTV